MEVETQRHSQVIVKGLDKSVTQRDLGYFFWDRDCECEGVATTSEASRA